MVFVMVGMLNRLYLFCLSGFYVLMWMLFVFV